MLKFLLKVYSSILLILSRKSVIDHGFKQEIKIQKMKFSSFIAIVLKIQYEGR